MPSSSLQALQASVFDNQPTPTILLSVSDEVRLVNKACSRLFEHPQLLVGKFLDDLHIRWQDGSNEALHELLTQHNGSPVESEPSLADHGPPLVTLKLQVETVKEADQVLVRAQMTVVDLDVMGEAVRLLSFESLSESTIVQSRMPARSQTTFDSGVETSSSGMRKRPPLGSTAGSYMTPAEHMDARFAQLRDAIYFANMRERPGFLLSADESFCYPSYRVGEANVTPVEIDDMEMFFDGWSMWDPDFKRKLSIWDYPAPWLNRNRVPFRNWRYGIKEEGKDIILECTGQCVYDPDTGDYIGCVIWITSLGEWQEVVQNDLKASMMDFRTICNRLPHLLWTIDSEGNADYFSESWYEWSGLTEAQALGTEYTKAIWPEDLERMLANLGEASKSNSEVHHEARYRRADGQWRWMYARAKPLTDGKGNVLKWYGSVTDVHEMVTARIEAERQKTQLMGILSHGNIGLFEGTVDGKLKVLEGKLGWVNEQCTNLSLADLTEDEEPGTTLFKIRMQEVMQQWRQVAVFEAQIRSRWYKFRLLRDSVTNTEADYRCKVLGCSVDVTEQHQWADLQAENARLTAETSVEMEKNRLKTAFLAHVSHEIRTPIAQLIGTVDMLADTTLTPDQLEEVHDIQSSATNLLTIVNDILDLSKIEAGELKLEKLPFDVSDLLTQVARLFSNTARVKSIDLRCRVRENIEMLSDPGRVTQIITNLVSNALKFTANGAITISAELKGNTVRIVVEDTGEGISKQTLSTLFRPFVQGDATTARRHGGTGLGLTISRNLAQRMGGDLYLESTPSIGTRAILSLPKRMGFSGAQSKQTNGTTGSESAQTSSHLSATSAHPQNGLTHQRVHDQPTPGPTRLNDGKDLVLIVEDNAINQKVAINQVKKLGYALAVAWNGQEALDYLEHHAPPNSEAPSAILMDCQMPVVDGYEATRRLRSDPRYQKMRSVPVIALTASAISGDKEKCQACGMDDYLSKPVNKSLLKSMLEKWIPAKA